jgi:hypothetical protein
MKIFWSWQSDTPKEIGRFFVRDALREAIQALKTDEDFLEPVEREVAARLELDSDRQGVPGSPDLAATIFEKIEAADVFLADVTLVGATPDSKKLINSNVAIEYGHAHHALSFRRVLNVLQIETGDQKDDDAEILACDVAENCVIMNSRLVDTVTGIFRDQCEIVLLNVGRAVVTDHRDVIARPKRMHELANSFVKIFNLRFSDCFLENALRRHPVLDAFELVGLQPIQKVINRAAIRHTKGDSGSVERAFVHPVPKHFSIFPQE